MKGRESEKKLAHTMKAKGKRRIEQKKIITS